MTVIKSLIITGLVLVGLCDVLAIITLFFLRERYIQIRKFRIRNWLGGHLSATRAWQMTQVTVGLMILVGTQRGRTGMTDCVHLHS